VGIDRTKNRDGWEKDKKVKTGWGICYNHPNMRNSLKITAFILIIIGTAGLLLNEFAWEHSTTCTIIFAILNLLGLISLAIISFSRGKEIT